tara:strand:+ start:1030 stop:2058 length:1029 start_codon:yes stop_codon:yes gene_type:complete
MKLLITGGCGFIGSNFILNQITDHNNIILNYDALTYAGRGNNLSSIESSKRYSFIKGDIADSNLLENIFLEFMPDAVINFAAESHVDRSISLPNDFIQTNIVGTYKLLSCATDYYNKSKNDNFKFIHISTDEVYGSLDEHGTFTEDSPYKPNSPYSASKASSDFLVKSWFNTYKLPSIVTNCSNNYGPYQYPEKLIPLIIISCLQEKKLPVYGNGKNIRDWLHVKDHCRAICAVLDNGFSGETYNIGGNNELTNISIVNKICELLDEMSPSAHLSSYKELITFVKDRPGHDFRYAIDSSKANKNLNWVALENFETGLKDTVLWYIENEKWWKNIQENELNSY